MLDIKKEIQVLLVRNGISMRKMLTKMKDEGITNIQGPSLSRMLADKTIRFELVQRILDYLGYEIIIKQKD